MKIRISITIDAECKKQLDEICEAFGLSRSHYLRTIIQQQYFNYIAHPNSKLNIKRK